jgi:transposase InsO family protein
MVVHRKPTSKLEVSKAFTTHSSGDPVNVHKNAKLTPAGRALLVRRIETGERAEVVAREMGVSRRTAFKWLKRYREEGQEGLEDRSSKPHRHPRRIPRARRRQIERLRKKRWSSPRIADHLKMPVSTVTVEVRRLGLNRLSRLAPPDPVVRYERARPGSLVHMDIKKLARITHVGHRIHKDRSRRGRGAGWEFYHAAIDDASRVAYGEILRSERKEDVTAFLLRVVAFFERQGVKISQLMTDNGSAYRSKLFRRTLDELGIRHLFTRPYTPKTNGKVERFIRTAAEEWAYGRPYPNSKARTNALFAWLRYYNLTRRHAGIRRRTPFQRLVELRVNNVLATHT